MKEIDIPVPSTKEDLILEKLGPDGLKRWQYFSQHFSGSWGGAKQKPLSPLSQEMLQQALSHIQFPTSARPSLFLTDEGFFELAWRNEAGLAIQIEFGSAEAEIFIEETGEEFTISHPDLASELINRFGS